MDLQSFFMGVETNKNMQIVFQVEYLFSISFVSCVCILGWYVNEASVEETFFSPMYSKKTPTPPHRSWVFLHRVEKKHANCARDYPHANPNIRTYIIYKPIHSSYDAHRIFYPLCLRSWHWSLWADCIVNIFFSHSLK